MKIKNILKSTLAGILLVATIATTAFAANYNYVYNFDATLDRSDIVESDKKVFTSGGRGTAEATGIFGSTTQYNFSIYTKLEGGDWTEYVDDSITWSLKDNTLVISGDGVTASCRKGTSPFYDNPYIKTIIIEDTVKQVDYELFTGLPNLETIFVMNANTALNKSVLEAPKLKAIIYGAGLNDEQYINHYAYKDSAITDDCEIIVLSKNVAVQGKFYDLTIRNDVNLSLENRNNGVYLPLTTNGVVISENANTSLYSKYAIETFTDYEDKLSYSNILARVRSYTQNLPQTAKNMLPAELTTGTTNSKPTVNNTVSNWATADVNRAKNIGIVPETLPVNFTQNITREDFCEIIAPLYEKITGEQITERIYFSDTNSEAVEKLAGLGIVGGVGSNLFGPNNTLTRAEAAAIFARMGNKLGIRTTGATKSFTDCTNHWAKNEIQTCSAMGLMGGVTETTFAPSGKLTIEQAIVIALRAYDML